MKMINLMSLALISVIFFSSPSHQASPPPPPTYTNPRLLKAYTALQAWKHAITYDPKGFTSNWYGYNVCNYTGVYCAPAPDDSRVTTVAGIDINHGDISGSLPEDLSLLSDLTLFHINSNRFYGTIPSSFRYLRLLHELDVSNNNLAGNFPLVVLELPSLKFLDIRFNYFYGDIPASLFNLKLDALFVNNNNFRSLPNNIGNSPVSVFVLANNNLGGCLPASFAKMAGTLKEVVLINAGLTGCLPPEIGLLKDVTVFDISNNAFVGSLPASMGEMRSLEQLNVANNKFSGKIPESICSLPRLENFTFSGNYLYDEPAMCLKLADKDDRRNCIPYRPMQRSSEECTSFYAHPADCAAYGCWPKMSHPSPPPPRRSPPPPPFHRQYP